MYNNVYQAGIQWSEIYQMLFLSCIYVHLNLYKNILKKKKTFYFTELFYPHQYIDT